MKVEAKQTIPVTVDVNDDEIYRIIRSEILRIYNLPDCPVIIDGMLCRVWWEDFGPYDPYDPEELKEEIRRACADDIVACAVLEQIRADYKGLNYEK